MDRLTGACLGTEVSKSMFCRRNFKWLPIQPEQSKGAGRSHDMRLERQTEALINRNKIWNLIHKPSGGHLKDF